MAMETFVERAGLREMQSSGLLKQALRHSSSTLDKTQDNGRLEALGDRVLQYVVCSALLQRLPGTPHYKLQAIENGYVNNATLARVAEELGMTPVIQTAGGEPVEVRGKDKVLASALEALIGAVFKERGIEAATDFIESHILSLSSDDVRQTLKRTPVQGLTLMLRESNLPYPRFRVKTESGKQTHNTRFTMEALCHNTVIGSGTAASKRQATAKAAADAIESGQWKALRGAGGAAQAAYDVGPKGI